MSGPGSPVSIANDYGQDGAGSNPGGDEIFRLPRPAMGPRGPPRKSTAIPLPTLWATPEL